VPGPTSPHRSATWSVSSTRQCRMRTAVSLLLLAGAAVLDWCCRARVRNDLQRGAAAERDDVHCRWDGQTLLVELSSNIAQGQSSGPKQRAVTGRCETCVSRGATNCFARIQAA
jgi:hypothetical protein